MPVNPWVGQVELELGDHSDNLRFDLNAIAELEELLKAPVGVMFDKEKVGILQIRAAIYVGLRRPHKRGLSIKKIGKVMDPTKLAYYGQKVAEALSLCLVGKAAFEKAMREEGYEGDEGNSGETSEETPEKTEEAVEELGA